MGQLKQLARQIFHETLAGINIAATMARKLDRSGSRIRCGDMTVDLAEFREIRVVAFGKASHTMVDGLLHLLEPEFRATGIISAPTPPPRDIPGFRTFLSGHPVPNEGSFAAGAAILDLLAGCDDRTLVFFLLCLGLVWLIFQTGYRLKS